MNEVWTKLQGHVVNGRYPLRRFLAGSDHSGVYLTDWLGPEVPQAAIKLIPEIPSLANAQLARWEMAAELAHPHLIRILQVGRCQLEGLACLYIVMEYADQNLADLLLRRALTEEEAREMLLPALSALSFLHNRNVVHGQLKPANLLAVGDQLKLASDTIRVISEATGRSNVATLYDPPEAREGSYSAAGDMWALGLTLYEALTRSPPTAVRERGVTFPANFSPAFREIITRCLSRRPFDRPKVAELEAWLRRDPAPAMTAPERLTATRPAATRGQAVSAAPAGSAVSAAQSARPAASAPSTAQANPAGPVPRQPTITAAQLAAARNARTAPPSPPGAPSATRSPQPAPGLPPARAGSTPPTSPVPPPMSGAAPSPAGPLPARSPTAVSGASPAVTPRQPTAMPDAAAFHRLAAKLAQSPAMRPAQPVAQDASASRKPAAAPRMPPPRQSDPGTAVPRRPAPVEISEFTPAEAAQPGQSATATPAPAATATDPLPRFGGNGPAILGVPAGGAGLTLSGTSGAGAGAAVAETSTVGGMSAIDEAIASIEGRSIGPAQASAHPTSKPVSLVRLTIGTLALLALAWAGIFAYRVYRDSVSVSEASSDTSATVPSASTIPVTGTHDAAGSAGVTQLEPAVNREPAPSATPEPEPAVNRVEASGTRGSLVTGDSEAVARSAPQAMRTASVRAGADQPATPGLEPVHEEFPDVPAHSRQTIRGHVRVAVRVIVDKDGSVFAALVDRPGPSQYFERLALDAAKKWSFARADAPAQRLMLVTFDFSRDGTSGSAVPLR